MATVDRLQLPQTASYLEQLPNDLMSYPDVTMRSGLLGFMRIEQPNLLDDLTLPPQVAQAFARNDDEAWIPEVIGNVLRLILLDRFFAKDFDGWLEWAVRATTHLFAQPPYRALMATSSPTLAVMGATMRWNKFHVGTTLTAETPRKVGNRATSRATVTFPPNLWDPVLIDFMAGGFIAAMETAGGEQVRASTRLISDTEAYSDVTWVV